MTELFEKVKKHAKEADAGWGHAYGKFGSVIEEKNLKNGVEVGVAFGGHAESLLSTTSIEKLFGVDPYMHIEGYDDSMNLPQEEFDQVYSFTIDRLNQFGNRYQHIRRKSIDAADKISDIDFVYIDADHSYQGVWNDLVIWFPKIRDGGIIGGHDYNHPHFPGVKQAVDEFFRRFNWIIHYEGDNVWWVEKEPISISFIIPAFLCEKTIKESIESIFKTNYSLNDEVIIVYDIESPSDNLEDELQKIKELFPQIKMIKHSIPRGGGVARNIAIENCNNPLIFCLDSDNVLAPLSIHKLKSFLINSGADVASFQELHFFIDSTKKVTQKWIYKSGSISLNDCLSNGQLFPGSSGNYLYTKDSWIRAGGYPEFTFLDTWGFGFRQLVTGSKMRVMENSFYFHRHGHDSYWIREDKKGTTSLQALQIILPYLYLIKDTDVEYLLSKRGRDFWFSELSTKPIRLKKYPQEPSTKEITRKLLQEKIISFLKKIKTKFS